MPGVAKNIFHLLTSSVLQKAIAFVYFALIARWAGVADTGAYFSALSWTLLFSTVTDMGLTSVLIRESAKDHVQVERYLNQTLALKLPLTVIAVAAALVGSLFFRMAPETRFLVVLATLILSLDTISLTFYGVLRGHHVLKYEGFGLIVGQGLTMLVGLTAIKIGAPIGWLIVALIAGSCWNAMASYWIVRTRLLIRPRFSWDWGFAKSLLKIALPFAVAGLCAKVYTNVDAVLLTHFKDETAAGLYSVPYKLTFAFQFVPMAFTAAFYPAMSRAWATNREELGGLLYKALKTLLLIAMPIIAGLMALAPELVPAVFGSKYLPAVPAVQVLVTSLIFIFLDFPLGSLLNATDRQLTQTKLMGMATVISVALNVILIPFYGIMGVVVASLFSHAALALGGFIVVGRFIDWPKGAFMSTGMRTILAAAVMGFGVFLAKPHLPLAVSILLGALLYPAAAFAFRAVTMADLRAVIAAVLKRSV